MRTTLKILAVTFALLAAGPAAADEADPFAGALFTPEEVIRHQSAIGLSKGQRQGLITLVTEAQADFLPAQMEIAEDAEELKNRLAEPRIDEAAALAVAARMLELEAGIKRRHLELAIRIKNLLDEAQQRRLRELRDGE